MIFVSKFIILWTRNIPKGGKEVKGSKFNSSEGFNSIYKEIADLIGVDNTYVLYTNMRGLQVSFPKRLYTTEFILMEYELDSSQDIRKLAQKYDYTEKYLRQLLKENGLISKEKEGI